MPTAMSVCQEESGARSTAAHFAPSQRRRRDFLGYYKALGISLDDPGVRCARLLDTTDATDE